ncbi:MAG TPA: hypothetical protein VKA68_14070 [bacterium]|nr:hypothetical protein [bacterium]
MDPPQKSRRLIYVLLLCFVLLILTGLPEFGILLTVLRLLVFLLVLALLIGLVQIVKLLNRN